MDDVITIKILESMRSEKLMELRKASCVELLMKEICALDAAIEAIKYREE